MPPSINVAANWRGRYELRIRSATRNQDHLCDTLETKGAMNTRDFELSEERGKSDYPIALQGSLS
jgi:hypothetical protein